jgi:hypothetical protein
MSTDRKPGATERLEQEPHPSVTLPSCRGCGRGFLTEDQRLSHEPRCDEYEDDADAGADASGGTQS